MIICKKNIYNKIDGLLSTFYRISDERAQQILWSYAARWRVALHRQWLANEIYEIWVRQTMDPPWPAQKVMISYWFSEFRVRSPQVQHKISFPQLKADRSDRSDSPFCKRCFSVTRGPRIVSLCAANVAVRCFWDLLGEKASWEKRMPGFGSAMNARPPGISFFCKPHGMVKGIRFDFDSQAEWVWFKHVQTKGLASNFFWTPFEALRLKNHVSLCIFWNTSSA